MPCPCLSLSAAALLAPALVSALGAPAAVDALAGRTFALIEGAWLSAPTLVLALSALLILPVVALISVAAQATRRYRRRRAALRAASRGVDGSGLAGDLTGDMLDTASLPPRSQAWLTVEGVGGTVALAGQVVRIGRHPDNDIRLTDRSVHRHHAVIERTPEEAFLIVDLSGKDGDGVRVNGQPTERMQLADGDVIELGRARLRFENEATVPVHCETLEAKDSRPAGIEG